MHKKQVEPITILCVYQDKNKIIAILTYSNDKEAETFNFKNESKLEKFIQENNIQNVIEGVQFEKI